nr:ABC-F family ATP-binding cassette domain-containing protein [Arthrobacter sp. UM1]
MFTTPSSISNARALGGHLRLDGVSHSFGDRRVLTDVSFTASAGSCVGLVGENGSGKSTLLKIAAGALDPDAGDVRVSIPGIERPRRGLLHQAPPFGPRQTVGQALDEAVEPQRAVAARLETLAARLADAPEDPDPARAYSAALDEAERLDVWSLEARVESMMSGLGLSALPRGRLTSELSGGQRARLSLAWVLLSMPDVLLLDEPTNHLDDNATAHLVEVLRGWRSPVLTASHDRAFLEEAVTSLVDLEPTPLAHSAVESLLQGGAGTGIGTIHFTGRFSDYLGERARVREQWERQYRAEQEELGLLREKLRTSHTVGHPGAGPRTEARGAVKFYSDRNATVVSRRVRDARSRLLELEAEQVRKPPRPLRFEGLDPGGAARHGEGELLAAMQDVEEAQRLQPVSAEIRSGERWLVTGANGAGKSTLLSLIAGLRAPSSGSLWLGPGVTVSLLAQETELGVLSGAMPHQTARELYAKHVGAERAEQKPLAGYGLFRARDEDLPFGSLSLGQQRRLELAVLLADPPDILLLDEPTNHLSLTLVTEIEQALPSYPGAVVVASHDRWLRKQWAGRHLEIGRS